MSGYFESLDWQGKKRYKEKLETVVLSLEDDPYCSLPIQRFEVTTHFPSLVNQTVGKIRSGQTRQVFVSAWNVVTFE